MTVCAIINALISGALPERERESSAPKVLTETTLIIDFIDRVEALRVGFWAKSFSSSAKSRQIKNGLTYGAPVSY
jgi:hypothetical protein